MAHTGAVVVKPRDASRGLSADVAEHFIETVLYTSVHGDAVGILQRCLIPRKPE